MRLKGSYPIYLHEEISYRPILHLAGVDPYCVENGGTYEIRRAADGSQTGVCILEDGAEVEAWDYFREKAG